MGFDWKAYCMSKYPQYMTTEQLKIYVVREKITPEDFFEISGEEYSA